MNRYKLVHHERVFLSHNIWRGEKFFLTKEDFPMKYTHPDMIEIDFIEDELVLYFGTKHGRRSQNRNSMNITELEKYYLLEDGSRYDEGLKDE